MVLLDVRSADEYRQGHLPQAVALPFAELVGQLEELPRTGTSWLTAEGRSAFLPTRPCSCSQPTTTRRCAWKKAFPIGSIAACPTRWLSKALRRSRQMRLLD